MALRGVIGARIVPLTSMRNSDDAQFVFGLYKLSPSKELRKRYREYVAWKIAFERYHLGETLWTATESASRAKTVRRFCASATEPDMQLMRNLSPAIALGCTLRREEGRGDIVAHPRADESPSASACYLSTEGHQSV
jgi:hypothetical protein